MFRRACLKSVEIIIIKMKEFHALPIKIYFVGTYWVQSWVMLHHSILFSLKKKKQCFFSLMNILTVCQASLFVLAKCIYVGFKRILVAQLCKWEQLKNEKGGEKIEKNQADSTLKRCSDQRKLIENLLGQLFSLTYLHIFMYSWPFFSELPWNEELKCRFLFLTTITVISHQACSVLITKTFTLQLR